MASPEVFSLKLMDKLRRILVGDEVIGGEVEGVVNPSVKVGYDNRSSSSEYDQPLIYFD
jgi:hypothetical protein